MDIEHPQLKLMIAAAVNIVQKSFAEMNKKMEKVIRARLTVKVLLLPILSPALPKAIRPTIVNPPIADRRAAAHDAEIPRSVAWGATCTITE